MNKGVSAEQSSLRQFGPKCCSQHGNKVFDYSVIFHLLHQSSKKSRVLLYVFQDPCNLVRYIAPSLKGNVLLFFPFTFSIKMLLVENPFKVRKRKIKIGTYPRNFNYCINCSWRCCGYPYYEFMRWISLICFREAQHECCTRNVLHESRYKQDVTNNSGR